MMYSSENLVRNQGAKYQDAQHVESNSNRSL